VIRYCHLLETVGPAEGAVHAIVSIAWWCVSATQRQPMV